MKLFIVGLVFDKKKQQKEEADYYFNEAKKIIESHNNHILHLD